MTPRLLLVVGLGVGYLLGARAGREQYDRMKAKATQLWEDPRVRKARNDVEAYARQQAPIIRERAEAAAKAAPGVLSDTAKDVADKVSTTAKDVADRVSTTARDVAGKVSTTSRDVAGKVSATAKDVADKVGDVATDVRGKAGKTAANLKDKGEAAVDRAVISAGQARDAALETDEDDDSRL
jgi:hypothetical protein